MTKNNPDDRRDNESKIKATMSATQGRINAAKEMIADTDNPKMKADLKAKNQRRQEALRGMNIEMKQEAEFNEGADQVN